jgi:two-component sensor histidine kinase
MDVVRLLRHALALAGRVSGHVLEASRGSFSLRAHLMAFGVAIFLPNAIFAGFLLAHVTRVEREEAEAWIEQIAKNLATDVDRDLEQRLTVLKTLATSPALADGDLAGFHAQAKAALAGTGAGAFLLDPVSQQQLVNTYVPFGTELPTYGSPETAARAIKHESPQFSGYFIGRVSRKSAFDIAAPVLIDGKLKYVLALGLLPQQLVSLLQGSLPDPNWTASIIDQNDVVLARSRNHEEVAGRVLPEAHRQELERSRGHLVKSVSLDGRPVWRAVRDSQVSGWHISVSVPVAVARAPLTESLWLWAVLAAIALASTFLLAVLFARSMERPMRNASAAAAALGRAVPVQVADSRLDEAQTIVNAIREASLELKHRSDQQQLLLRELTHRVKNILAVVQSVAMRTLAGNRPPPEARDILLDRIRALARAHDLLIQTEWKGARLTDIVAAELAPFAGRCRIEGPNLVVEGGMVQTFTLLLHELATNAAKYGALSNEKGSVAVTWAMAGRGSDRHLTFRWEERGGPPVQPPSGEGFGSALLRAAIPGDPEAQPRLSFDRAGFVYEIEIPLEAIVRA